MQKPSDSKKVTRPKEERGNILKRIAQRNGIGEVILLPILSVFTALMIGGLLIIFSNPHSLNAWGNFLSNPLNALAVSWKTVLTAYQEMLVGAFGSPTDILAAIQSWSATGETRVLLDAFRPISESLVLTTPYIFAGLGVALAFRGGLFNIGAEGQLFMGGIASVYVGYAVTGLPMWIHMPLALLAGVLAGALWGAVPGILKARTGAHEVINTIMMNYIAFRMTDYLLSGPMGRQGGTPISPDVLSSAYIPALFGAPMRLHWGFFLALIMAWVVYWFLWKTPLGMEIRMVGANPRAARYAGIRVISITTLTMALSGVLAGMAGAVQALGVDHRMVRAFSSGYGFDAIALALLGNSHPIGVVLAALLFGLLRGGAARMQVVAGTPVELISIVQGIVLLFIAAPEIIRSLYRIKAKRHEHTAAEATVSS